MGDLFCQQALKLLDSMWGLVNQMKRVDEHDLPGLNSQIDNQSVSCLLEPLAARRSPCLRYYWVSYQDIYTGGSISPVKCVCHEYTPRSSVQNKISPLRPQNDLLPHYYHRHYCLYLYQNTDGSDTSYIVCSCEYGSPVTPSLSVAAPLCGPTITASQAVIQNLGEVGAVRVE